MANLRACVRLHGRVCCALAMVLRTAGMCPKKMLETKRAFTAQLATVQPYVACGIASYQLECAGRLALGLGSRHIPVQRRRASSGSSAGHSHSRGVPGKPTGALAAQQPGVGAGRHEPGPPSWPTGGAAAARGVAGYEAQATEPMWPVLQTASLFTPESGPPTRSSRARGTRSACSRSFATMMRSPRPILARSVRRRGRCMSTSAASIAAGRLFASRPIAPPHRAPSLDLRSMRLL